MRRDRVSRLVCLVAAAGLSALAGPTVASAAPANDAFASATLVSSVPFSGSGDLDGATIENGEQLFCSYKAQTVWYKVALPNATPVTIDLNGSDPSVTFAVYQSSGTDITGLGFMFGSGGCGGSPEFTTQANAVYYIQVGSFNTGSAHFQLNLQPIPPPVNDNFADATVIQSRPLVDSDDLTAATTESGEPLSPGGLFPPLAATAWYSYTPQVAERLLATVTSYNVSPVIAVYTGDSLQGLQLVASRSGFGTVPLVFPAAAGTTYYIQLGRGAISGGAAPVSFTLADAPPPVAQFGFYPGDPSIYDAVQFYDNSYDPAQVGLASEAWQFGDGTSGTGGYPAHVYASDGDYTVGLTVTTIDGRVASTSQVVHVRTHDVAIVKFSVPTSARTGQTRQLTVGIRNSLYPENVQVQLFRSTPAGFQLVGTLTQLIPVRPANQTTPVSFSYTFSANDAAVGKVTFEAVATLAGARDAIPADNTVISSPPTKVTP